MKLIRPTDDELNAAFAEKVCGAIEVEDGMMRLKNENVRGVEFERWRAIPDFTQSADVVLPYLEKLVRRSAFNDHTITVTGENYYIDGPGGNLSKAPTLAKACVLALLRAHGVEVET